MKRIVAVALLLLASSALDAQVVKNFTLIMRTTGMLELWDHDTIRTYGFATKLNQFPPLPGPPVIVNEGDSVYVLARNISQGPPHTIHWHGLDVDQANDGTPATSFELYHNQSCTYAFKATHAGTYLYHCHMGDVVHVQMGMYGFVIVRAKDSLNNAWTGGPAYDKEYSWLSSEIDKKWHDSIPETDHDSAAVGHESFPIPPYHPGYFLVNGKSRQQIVGDSATVLRARANEMVYLRIGNMGFCDHRFIFPPALHARVTDSDGRLLPLAFNSDTVDVAPGERYGLMLQSTVQFADSVQVQFFDMNSHLQLATEWVPLDIRGNMGLQEESLETSLHIFPNPGSGELNVVDARGGFMRVGLVDMLGREQAVAEGTGSVRIDCQHCNAGLYIARIESSSGLLLKKVLLQK